MQIIDRLTVGDLAIVEELSGQGIAVLGDETAPKAKLMAALVYVFKRKQDKDFTFQDALNLTLEEAQEILGLSDDDENLES